jgi:glycosyltransferase involved in cell wall biosynthesis
MDKKNILMLSESNYPFDVRVKQEAELLYKYGYNVSIIAIKENEQKLYEIIEGVKVYRIPKIEIFNTEKQQNKDKKDNSFPFLSIIKGIIGYGIEYGYFTLVSLCYSLYILIKNKFDIIHTHNPPDTLVFIALFYKYLFGKKYIFDHHDLSPDLYLVKYPKGPKIIYKILINLEVLSCKIADKVIATNQSYKNIEIKRADINPEKIFVVRNGPDVKRIKKQKAKNVKTTGIGHVLLYLGAVNFQDGVHNLIEVMDKIVNKNKRRDILLIVVGDGDYLIKIKELASAYYLDKFIKFTGYIYDSDELNKYLSTADIFVDAAPKTFLNDNSTFIKHMEYMLFGKPVVSFDLKESRFTLEKAGLLIKNNDTDEMAKQIIALCENKKRREEIGEFARERALELTWDKVSTPLLDAYSKF